MSTSLRSAAMRLPRPCCFLALLAAAALIFPLAGCGGSKALWTETGQASWYGKPFHGRKTASGETYNMNKKTAAHPSLGFGTLCRVTNLKTGESVKVRINDHFPGTKGRVIDLSRASFKAIADLDEGVIQVRVEVIEWPEKGPLWRRPPVK